MAKQSIVSIDKYRLDEECVGQADKYLEAAAALAHARAEFDSAKARAEVVKAECEIDVRSFPKKFGIKVKVSEAVVKAGVVLHARVQKFARILNAKKLAVGILEAQVSALDQRKRMLEKLCDLDAREYFSRPAKPKETMARERREDADFARRGGKK